MYIIRKTEIFEVRIKHYIIIVIKIMIIIMIRRRIFDHIIYFKKLEGLHCWNITVKSNSYGELMPMSRHFCQANYI